MKAFSESRRKWFGRLASSFSLTEKLIVLEEIKLAAFSRSGQSDERS